MSEQTRLTRNYLSLAGARFASKLLSFGAAVVAARHLGAADFGVFTFSFAAVTVAVVVFQMGFTSLVVREVARDRAQAPRYLTTSLVVRFAGTALVTAVAGAIYAATAAPGALAATITAAAFLFATLLASCTDIFQAFERMEYTAALNVFNNLLLLALVSAVAFWRGDLNAVLGAYVAANALSFVAALAVCSWRFARPAVALRWTHVTSFCRAAVPFSLSAFVANLFWRSDRILLKALVGDRAVGIYGAAATMVEGLVMVAGSFREAVYPVLSRFWPHAQTPFRDVSRTAFKFLVAVALPLGIGTSLVAVKLFPLIYGGAYEAGWPVLAVLIWALVAIFIRELTAGTLYAQDLQNAVLASNALGALVAIALNVALIPHFSYMGAAYTGVGTAFLTTAFNLVVIGRKIRRLYPWHLVVRPLVASGAMAAVVLLTFRWSAWVNVLAGAAVYAGALVATGYYRPRQLLQLIRAG